MADLFFSCAAPKVFLCHASEDAEPAGGIAVALCQAGCKVFFDEHSLPPGGDYHKRIHAAIRKCNLFVFLMTPESLKLGKYTINELEFARERWKNPAGHVLPVNIGAILGNDVHVPPYLGAVTIYTPSGNLAAGVRHEVEKILQPRAKAKCLLKVLAGAVAVSTVASLWPSQERPPPPDASQPPIQPAGDRVARPTDCSRVLPSLIEAQNWSADTLNEQSAGQALALYRGAYSLISSQELRRRVDAATIDLAEKAASDNNPYLAAQRYAAAFQPLVMDCSSGGGQ